MKKEYEQEYRRRAEELAEQMTLQEKISQMMHRAPAIERLGIPAYNWWNEALHGVARAGTATVFPQAIALAAGFDEQLAERVAEATASEGRAKYNMQQMYGDGDIYKGLTFWAPNLNIFRDPRWGRGHETYGEDPYLTARLGVGFIRGLQGDDERFLKTAACAKHFAVHSGPEDERHVFNAQVSARDMAETYMPAFEAAVKEAGVEAVMGAYNRVNGEPCCGSKTLLGEILRERWHFSGHVVSDCWAIKDFHEGHGVTTEPAESVAMAVNNGCDLNCGNLFLYLEEAVRSGRVSEETITEAVVRLFTTRMKLGMFEKETPFDRISYGVVDSPQMRRFNKEVAKRCVVLLKNADRILPLDPQRLGTIGIIGPNADNRRALVGNYEGTAGRYVTVAEGIQDYLEAYAGDRVRVMVSTGCHLYEDRFQGLAQADDRFSEALGIAREADVLIACLGLDAGLEGEEGDQGNQFASGDKPDLKLPGRQQALLELLLETGKPVIVLVLSGSALALDTAQERADAVVQCWYPGAEGGRAVAELLFGKGNPEGKLPVTFYSRENTLPDFRDYSMEGRTYRYMTEEPLYPFGYGLSYTSFACKNARADTNLVTEDGVYITCELENTGPHFGRETIQVYVKAAGSSSGDTLVDSSRSSSREASDEHMPNAQLKAFCKIGLQPGESRSIRLHLPERAFALCDERGEAIVEKGDYVIYVGTCQPDRRSVQLTGVEPAVLRVTSERRCICSGDARQRENTKEGIEKGDGMYASQ